MNIFFFKNTPQVFLTAEDKGVVFQMCFQCARVTLENLRSHLTRAAMKVSLVVETSLSASGPHSVV